MLFYYIIIIIKLSTLSFTIPLPYVSLSNLNRAWQAHHCHFSLLQPSVPITLQSTPQPWPKIPASPAQTAATLTASHPVQAPTLYFEGTRLMSCPESPCWTVMGALYPQNFLELVHFPNLGRSSKVITSESPLWSLQSKVSAPSAHPPLRPVSVTACHSWLINQLL